MFNNNSTFDEKSVQTHESAITNFYLEMSKKFGSNPGTRNYVVMVRELLDKKAPASCRMLNEALAKSIGVSRGNVFDFSDGFDLSVLSKVRSEIENLLPGDSLSACREYIIEGLLSEFHPVRLKDNAEAFVDHLFRLLVDRRANCVHEAFEAYAEAASKGYGQIKDLILYYCHVRSNPLMVNIKPSWEAGNESFLESFMAVTLPSHVRS